MKNIFKIVSYTKHLWKWYAFMGFFVVSMSLLSLVTPVLLKQIVDVIVARISGNQADLSRIMILLGFIIATDIVTTIFSSFSMWIGDQLGVKLQTFLSRRFYEHVLNLDVSYFDNEVTGRIVNKMYRGIESITSFIQSMLNNFLPFFLTAVVTIILLSFYSVTIAVLLAILFPLYIRISHASSQKWEVHEGKKNAINDSSQGRVAESLGGIRVVKAFGSHVTELLSFVTAREKIEALTRIQTRQWHTYDFYRRFSLNIILFAILSYIVYFTYTGRYTIGEMTLLIQLVQQARFPLFAMSFILGQIQRASAGSADFFSILEKSSMITDAPDAKQLPDRVVKNSGNIIAFDKVSFSYGGSKNALSDITFSVRKGEKLALVGESGQGKSTLVNLILRFYEPQKGTISLYGVPIRSLKQDALRNTIAVVFQESLLFSGTIRENIMYGRPGATNADIEKAAKAANAYDFVRQLPDGLDSLVGERGVKLSGGQKQRIAIARAILKDAPIIILDEATSSLDSRSELEVQKGLEELMKGRTSIIIAHRLSTISGADKILVLAKSKIAQFGKPDQLLKDTHGMYAQMVVLQKKLLTASREEKEQALAQFDLVA